MKSFFRLVFIFLIIVPGILFSQTSDNPISYVFAKKLYDDKMYDLAAEQFHQFAEQNPENPKAAEALHLAGLSYFNIKEYQKAKKEFLLLILKFPDAKDLDRAQYKIAQCFQETGDLAAAAKSFRQVQVFYPKSPLAKQSLMMSAKMFFENKEYEKTAKILYEFLEIYPKSKQYHEAQLLLVYSFIENGKNDRANVELEKILSTTEIGEVNAEALLIKANLCYQSHYLQQAENDYQNLIEKYETRQFSNNKKITDILNESCYNLSNIYREKGMFEKSNEYLSKISDYQTDPKTLFLIAENYFSIREYVTAIELYEKVNSLPDSSYLAQSYFKLGHSHQALSDFINAVKAYEHILKLCDSRNDNDNPEICKLSYYKISECYLSMDQPNLAIAYLKKYRASLKNDKNIDAIDFRIAYLYETKANDLERAIRGYYDFIDNYSRSKSIDDAQFGLARCYERKNNYAQALVEYNNFIELYPASEHYSQVKQRIEYLQNYHQTGNEALTNLGSVIQQIAENKLSGIALYQLGLTYFKELKDYQSSINLFNKVYSAGGAGNIPKDELLYHLGRAYQLLAEKEEINQKMRSAYSDSASYDYNSLIENFPESSWTDDAAYHKIEIKKININKKDPTYFSQMKESLTSFAYKYLESPILDKVNLELGLLLLENGIKSSVDSLDVYNNFQNIITNFPHSPLQPDAAYYQAILFYKTNNLSTVEQRLNSFIADYSKNHHACKAYFLLSKISEMKEDYSAAINFLQHIITKYYYSDYADSARLIIGSFLKKQKKYSDALSHFIDIYEDNITDNEIVTESILQEAIFNIADILDLIHQRTEAIKFYQIYLVRFPQGKYADRVLFSLGELFNTCDKEDRTKARDYFQQIEKNFSSSDLLPNSLIKLGDIFFDDENYDVAKQYYLKSLNYGLPESDIVHASAQLIIGLYRLGQITMANERYKIFEKQFKNEKNRLAEILLEKGDYFLKSKNFNQAEKIFKDVRSDFKKYPQGAKAEFLLGKLYFILNKNEEALDILTDLIKKHPNEKILADVYITLGNFYYFEARQIENSMIAYKTAIEQPDIDESNLKLGMHNLIKCYSDLQLWDKAINLSREYLKKFPLAEDAFEKKIQIGYFYYQLKEYDYAIQIFKKIKPEADIDNEPRIQYWIGECYFGKGQFQQAISEYLKIAYLSKPAKLLNQYRVTAQYQAAIAYLKLGKLENAKQLFQKIITEQGAESVFGKPAKEKLDEVERLLTAQNQDIL